MSPTVYTHTSLYSSAVSLQCLHLQLEPQPHLRGPMVVAWSSNSNSGYNDGYTKGQNKANKIWENNYGSNGCYKISKYDTKIQNYISNNYDVNSYSDKYNLKKGAADGMNCRTVGIYSATQIAQRKCNSSSGSFKYPNKSKLGDSKDCYTIANDDCQGNIDQMIQTYCSNG
eukprot:scaffold34294_cov72-Skeletonema_dohrnii-CCMP3373.AAC.1